MATAYTIRLVDQASASAARVQASLSAVADAATRTAAAFQTTDRAYQAVARRAEQTARGELKVARALNAVDKAALSQQKMLDRYGRKTAPAATKATSGLTTSLRAGAIAAGAMAVGAVRIGRGFLEAAGRAEKFSAGLENLGKGDTRLAPAWTAELIRLRVPLEQGTADVQKLLASFKDVRGLDAGHAVNDILRLSAALQLSAEQSQSFNKVFSDTAGKGKIQREELTTQLAEIGIGVTIPGFLQEVAKSQGKSYAEAEKMLSTGKITADIAIPALITATKDARGIKDLEAEAMKRSQGIVGTLNNLDNAWENLKVKFGESLVKAGVLDDITRLADELTRISKLDFGPVFTGLKDMVSVLAFIPAWVFGQTAGRVAFTLEDGKLDAQARQRRRQEDAAAGADLMGRMPDAARTAGQDFGAGFAPGLDSTSGAAVNAATGLAESVIGATKSELEIHSPSRVMQDIGADTAAGMATGLDDHSDLAFGAAEALADGTIAEAEMAAATGAGVDSGRMANVGAAAGNALATGGGEGGRPVSVSIAITVDGAQGPAETVEQIREFFSTADFAALFERAVEGSGA